MALHPFSFKTLDGPITLMPAEVVQVNYSDAVPAATHTISVKLLDKQSIASANLEESFALVTAKPLNMNIRRLPLKGEVVLLIKAPSSAAYGPVRASTNYYLDIVSLQQSTHHNSLPNVSIVQSINTNASGDSNEYQQTEAGTTTQDTSSELELDSNFTENEKIRALQHYVGDLIIEGRYGQSLRFSSTQINGIGFARPPRWKRSDSAPEGTPITILRNSGQRQNLTRLAELETEEFSTDDNLIVLASGQELKFTQSSEALDSANEYGITSWNDEKWGTTPQILLSSGRIVFNSTQQEIIAFAKNGIALSSESPITIDSASDVSLNGSRIELGTSSDEQLILGTSWADWMEQLLDALAIFTAVTPAGPTTPFNTSPQWPQIEQLKAQIPELLSQLSFTKKNP